MSRFMLLIALCACTLVAVGQTPPTTPTTGQDPQTQTAPVTRGNRKMKKPLQKMDANADGKIARDEWKGNPQSFDTLDANADGSLTRQELRQAMRDKGAAALKQFDANSDGKIARDEWKGNPQSFDKLDTNADGLLTREELRQAAHEKGAAVWQQLDTNSDGKIARDEWTRNARAFDRLDANADGFLTPDEVRSVKGRRKQS